MNDANVTELKTGYLIENKNSTIKTTYKGKVVNTSFEMPWMYNGYGYKKDYKTSTQPSKKIISEKNFKDENEHNKV